AYFRQLVKFVTWAGMPFALIFRPSVSIPSENTLRRPRSRNTRPCVAATGCTAAVPGCTTGAGRFIAQPGPTARQANASAMTAILRKDPFLLVAFRYPTEGIRPAGGPLWQGSRWEQRQK